MEYRLLKILAKKSLQESGNQTTINEKENKTMTKYEIIEDTFEIRQNTPHASWTASEVVDGYLRDGNMDGRVIGSYDDLETAAEAFDKLEPDTREDRSCAFWFIHGTVYRLEENEYTDGEFDQGNFLEFKAKGYNG